MANICNKDGCIKKLKLFEQDMHCKCDLTFCTKHRLSFDHNCTFDFKNEFNESKKIESMKCVAKKIKKI